MLHRYFIFRLALVVAVCSVQVACDSNPGRAPGDTPGGVTSLLSTADSLSKAYPDSSLVYADSALALSVRMSLPDSIHLKAIHARAEALFNAGLPDSAFSVVQQYYLQKESWPDSSTLTMTLFYMGWYGYQNIHLNTAYKYISEAVQLAERVGPEQHRTRIIAFYADVLEHMGRYVEAQEWLFKAIRLAETSSDTFSLTVAYVGAGHVFGYLDDNIKSREYYRKALGLIRQINNQAYLCAVLGDIGLTYRHSNPDSALIYYNQALDLDPGGLNKRISVIPLYNKANLYADGKLNITNHLDTATELYKDVLKICEDNGIKEGIPIVYGGLATVAHQRGDYALSEKYYRKGVELCEEIGDVHTTAALLRENRVIYEKRNDWAALVKLDSKIRSVEDSISVAEKRMAINDIEWMYQLERKEHENEMLKKTLSFETSISHLRMFLLLLFAVALVVTRILYARNKRLNKGLTTAYNKLMEQYREERKNRQPLLPAHGSTYTGSVESRLCDYLDNEKPFLNPELRASDVMNHLQITQQELHEALKKQGFSNFNAFINYLRVQEVQNRFEDPAFDHHTIEAIAKDAGFKSRSTFYSVFEATTGVKPAYYRSRIRGHNG
ncbi:MAG: tetratricopeptide repeat protein [Bacteroidota bacterium]